MDLLFGLATVDKMRDDRLARQLARGWMGWESQTLRRVRARGARVLVALAARLDAAVLATRQEFGTLTLAKPVRPPTRRPRRRRKEDTMDFWTAGNAAALAERLTAPPDALGRVLGGLAQVGVFAQHAAGRFALTRLGEPLRTDAPGALGLTARLRGHPSCQRSRGDRLPTVRTGEPGFDHSCGQPSYTYLAGHPDIAALCRSFGGGGTAVVAAAVPERDAVGTGQGELTSALLTAQPRAGCVPTCRIRGRGARARDGQADRPLSLRGLRLLRIRAVRR